MKPIQSGGAKLFASLLANDTKLELVREAIDSLYHNRNNSHPASLANSGRKRRFSKSALLGITAICAPLLASTGSAADATNAIAAPLVLQKPAWLTDLSVGVKESFDDNVFESGLAPSQASGYPAPPTPGSVWALRDVSSFITTVSPKVGINFAPFLGDQKSLQALTLSYTPDFVTYHDAPSESYNAQRLTSTVKWTDDDLSFNLNEGFVYINGSKYGPTYPGDLLSAFATAADRERREQIQERATVSFQYDQKNWFVRPVASLLLYNLDTAQYFSPGYQNYPDRYDVNGGLDVGYKIEPKFALTVGYRYGHQDQSEFTFGPAFASVYAIAAAHSPNDYQRVLFGFEGKPWDWLTASLQIGPDFRSFDSTAPLDNKNPVTYYGEGALTATVSPKDTIAFKYKQWEWVSSTGLVPYFDSSFDLSYTRKVTDALSLSLGGRALGANYNPNNVEDQSGGLLGDRCVRNDWLYTVSGGLQYAFNANVSANLAYSYDLGVNEQDGLPGGAAGYQPRSFKHQLASFGVAFKF
jgi:opacity protein-like surface antigen